LNIYLPFIVVFVDLEDSFLIDKEDTIWVEGSNNYGELGIIEEDMEPNTFSVSEITKLKENIIFENDIIYITSGFNHSFFIDKNGNVYGCGNNLSGVLGIMENTVPQLTKISSISSVYLPSFSLRQKSARYVIDTIENE